MFLVMAWWWPKHVACSVPLRMFCSDVFSTNQTTCLFRCFPWHTHILLTSRRNIVTAKSRLSSRCLPHGKSLTFEPTAFSIHVLHLSLNKQCCSCHCTCRNVQECLKGTQLFEIQRRWHTASSQFHQLCPTHPLHNSTNSALHIVFTIPPTLPHTSSSQFHQLCPTHRLHNCSNSTPHIVFKIPPTLPHTPPSQLQQLYPTHRLHNSTNSAPHTVFTIPPTLPHTPSSQFHQLCPTHRLPNSTNSAPHTVFPIPQTLPHTPSSQFHQLCTTHHTFNVCCWASCNWRFVLINWELKFTL
jgi:hypothetical protein